LKSYYNNRHEEKYVLDFVTYFKILKELKVLFKGDSYGDKTGKYKVISLYYDTTNLDFFWEKVDGEEIRSKLRLRTYVPNSPDKAKNSKKNPLFLEIKKKKNCNVFKKRINIDIDFAEKFINNPFFDTKFINSLSENDKKALGEIAYLKSKLALRPMLLVYYDRQAFVSKDNLNVRVTFDTNIRYREKDLSLRTRPSDKHILHPSLAVMEIKYSNYLPLAIVQILQKYKCESHPFSKYCNGINNLVCEKPVLGEIYGVVY